MTAFTRICCFCLLLLSWALPAQDPFFTHFSGNEALFNPALTGTLGATTFSIKHKEQWQRPGHNGYQTSALVYEESMPCSLFDYGLSFVQDREGQGMLRTLKVGGMLAAYVPLGRGAKSVRPADLRIGTGLHWGQQSIDYSRLTFIDQLHPKYGRVGPNQQAILSSFVAPNGGQSDWYFQPSIGFNLRGIILAKLDNPVFGSIGGAVHNLVPLGNAEQGQSWSLLGIGTATIPRYSFHAEAEAVIKEYDSNNFLSVQPRFAGQVQGNLSYLELGFNVGFSQRLTGGLAYHTAQTNTNAPATTWGSIRLEAGVFNSPSQRLDLGLSYNFNLSGLRNFVGNTLEFTARWSLATSTICRFRGQKANYDGSDALECPTARGGRGRDKIYENIWYK
ncbi:MAG: PorP/SprF family type IX secretion system membrane protein [Bacteroidota bacterium]